MQGSSEIEESDTMSVTSEGDNGLGSVESGGSSSASCNNFEEVPETWSI